MSKLKMQKTYKFRLYPTRKQTEKLDKTLEICRILYNSCLVDRKAGYPRFKAENRYDSITYPQTGFEITDGKLKISKIGEIKLKQHRSINGNIKTCIIKKETDKWYVSLSVEYACTPIKRSIISKPVGIDMGIRSFVVTSDGQIIDNPKYLIKQENKLIKLQQKLSSKVKRSNNRKKARIIVAKLHKKIFNQRKDFQHKLSRQIINNYDMLAVEKLKIRNMVQNPYLSKSISDSGWGQFLNMLEYKAEEAGIPFFRIEPKYTSIDCNNCGTKVPKTLANRIHICPKCNIVIDRDINAAINIKQKAIEKIRQELPGYTLAEISSVDDRKTAH